MPGPCQAQRRPGPGPAPGAHTRRGAIRKRQHCPVVSAGSAVQVPEFSKNPSLGASRWPWCPVSRNHESRAISSIKAGFLPEARALPSAGGGGQEGLSHRGRPGTGRQVWAESGDRDLLLQAGFGVLWGLEGS